MELGILQRCAMHCSSQVDIDEAFMAGYKALKFAAEGNNGYMVALKRVNDYPYEIEYTLVEANKVANEIKYLF